jgi:CheY-like chemotaxis protein
MDFHPKTILYIEASDLIQAWVPSVLKRSGWAVTCVRDIESARRSVESENHFDVILLGDLTRPTELISDIPPAELSLVRAIRQSRLNRDTPIVIFTSYDWLETAREAGVNEHLVKPVGAEELEAILQPYVQQANSVQSV